MIDVFATYFIIFIESSQICGAKNRIDQTHKPFGLDKHHATLCVSSQVSLNAREKTLCIYVHAIITDNSLLEILKYGEQELHLDLFPSFTVEERKKDIKIGLKF